MNKEEVKVTSEDRVSDIPEEVEATSEDRVSDIPEEVEVTTEDDELQVLTKEDGLVEVEDLLKMQVNSIDSDKISDAVDEGQKIIDSTKKLRRKVLVKKVIALGLLIVLIILLLKSCGGEFVKYLDAPDVETSEDIDISSEIPHVDGYTAIPAIEDFTVSKSQPSITLYNPEINKGYSYLMYRFTDEGTGEVIYESKLVEPGDKFNVKIGEMLDIGKHNVLVEILNFDYDDYTVQKNGGQSNIVITVTK